MPFTTSWVKAITTGFVLVGASLALTAPVQSHPANQEHDHTVVELAQSGGIFSDEERRIIRDVLDIATGQTDQDSDKKDKGNKGKGNKGLPPGIAKRDLPDNLISRLPARTDGALRQIVGDDVVLIEKGTEIILDVIRDVARN